MRAVWPILWLLPAICGVAAVAWRVAGRKAALVVLLMVAAGMPALDQFKPGRTDHHNKISFCATDAGRGGADLTDCGGPASPPVRQPHFGLAIGYEALPVSDGRRRGACRALHCDWRRLALSNYGLALATGVVLAFAVTVSLARWSITACDALAVNMAVSAALWGSALVAARLPAFGSVAMRTGLAVVAAAVAALAAFIWLEPRCLGGLFAMTDRASGRSGLITSKKCSRYSSSPARNRTWR